MNREEILNNILNLSRSQGRWGRLYRALQDLKEEDPKGYEDYMSSLEKQNFKDLLEMVEYLESEMGYI